MTNEEVFDAMMKELPVNVRLRSSISSEGQLSYSKISAVILRRDPSGKVAVSVECMDQNKRSFTLTLPERVSPVKVGT